MAKIVSKIDELTGKTEQERILKEQFGFLQNGTGKMCTV